MKKAIPVIFFIMFCAIAHAQNNQHNRNRPFDNDWLFIKDTIQADAPSFDDTKWRTINLPHDWSIEDLPNQSAGAIEGPFDKNSIGQGATGFTDGGTGWYRKKFATDASFSGSLVTVHFDGV
jgi:beta-galactosidase